jgi:hypothetical protein
MYTFWNDDRNITLGYEIEYFIALLVFGLFVQDGQSQTAARRHFRTQKIITSVGCS